MENKNKKYEMETNNEKRYNLQSVSNTHSYFPHFPEAKKLVLLKME